VAQNLQVYSEGESASEFTVKISQLKPNAKLQRIMFLWKKAFLRSRAAAMLMLLTQQIKHSILTYGSTKNLNLKAKDLMKYANEKIPYYVLMPESKFRVVWNILMIFFILQTATYTPYRIAFITDSRPGDQYLDLSIDTYFVIDVLINFFTAFPDPVTGLLITNLRAIVGNYLKSDFLFDAVASFPFSILDAAFNISASGTGSNFAKLAKLPRLYRLARIVRIIKIGKLIRQNPQFSNWLDTIMVNFAVMRLVKTFFGVFFSIHLMGCLWFFVSTFVPSNNNWTVLTSMPAGGYLLID
jgi:hypothetical protein